MQFWHQSKFWLSKQLLIFSIRQAPHFTVTQCLIILLVQTESWTNQSLVICLLCVKIEHFISCFLRRAFKVSQLKERGLDSFISMVDSSGCSNVGLKILVPLRVGDCQWLAKCGISKWSSVWHCTQITNKAGSHQRLWWGGSLISGSVCRTAVSCLTLTIKDQLGDWVNHERVVD